tara:strand:- start:84 stop:281 length:198 start_codon:yes stop_codon:yes gene_type:complete
MVNMELYRGCEIFPAWGNYFNWLDPDNFDVEYFTDRAAPVVHGGHGSGTLEECKAEIDEYLDDWQ